MVCAHCGKLNNDAADVCSQCGRSLAATPSECCVNHSERRAIACCGRCDAPLCDECVVMVDGSPYCALHADALRATSSDQMLVDTPILDVSRTDTATVAQRLQAGVIDLVLLGVFATVVYLALWAFIGSPPAHSDAGGWRVLYWLLLTLGPLGYFVYEGAAGGQTVGKSVTDIIVVRPDGTLLDFNTAVLRGLLSVVGFVLLGVSFWFVLWDPQRRALHDILLSTIVVQE